MTIVQYIEVVASSADEASLPSSEQFVHTQCMKNMPYTTYPIQMECREDGKLYHRIKEWTINSFSFLYTDKYSLLIYVND